MPLEVQWIPKYSELLKNATADKGIAFRYALKNLETIVLSDADFSAHNKDHSLDLFDPDNPDTFDGMTEQYINSRAKMLMDKNIWNTDKLTHSTFDHYYTDTTLGIEFGNKYVSHKLGGDGNTQRYLFGSDKAESTDELTGGEKADFIFGGGGDDIIHGGDGNDYIEGNKDDDTLYGDAGNDTLVGGTGFDTYYIEDMDKVIDADGKGKILFKGIQRLPKLEQQSDTIWQKIDTDSKYVAIRLGDNLQLTYTKGNENHIANMIGYFQTATSTDDGYTGLGLTLGKADDTSKNTEKVTLFANPDYYATVYAGGVDKPFYMTGSNKDDTVLANGNQTGHIDLMVGNDKLYASSKADILYGNDGNDMIFGSGPFYENRPVNQQPTADDDKIFGGKGNDMIFGSVGNDQIYGNDEKSYSSEVNSKEKGDWLIGGSGDDTIYGSNGRDFLQGGKDSDIVIGGAGDDVILGDGGIRFGSKSQFIYVPPADDDITVTPSYPAVSLPFVPPGLQIDISTPTASTLSIEYNYKNSKWETVNQSSIYRMDKTVFNWDTEIDQKSGEFTLNHEVALSQNDHYLLSEINRSATDHLLGGAGDDLILGQVGDDYLFGNTGDDILWGDDFKDKDNVEISGNDYLDGGDDNDTLYGGLGDDILIGGKGLDILNGGDGHDYYHLSSKDDNTDTINDTDGKGEILIDGISLKDTIWNAIANNNGKEDTFEYNNYQVKLNGSDLSIINAKGKAIGIVKDFNSEDLGITLNHAPIANGSLGDETSRAGVEWIYHLPTNSFSDSDEGDTLNYTATLADGSTLPSWLTIDTQTGRLSGTPSQAEKLAIIIIATDRKGGVAQQPLNITIEPANHTPKLQSEFADVSVTENQAFTTQLDLSHFTDSDGDKLNYHISQADNSALPSWLRFDETTGILSGTPTDDQDITLKITATDTDGLSVSDEFILDVKAEPIITNAPWNGGTVNGGSGDDKLSGSWFTDTINGNDGDDVLSAGLGNDTVNGVNGNDIINGGLGNNTLIGGKGNDTLTAGLGADTYQFSAGDGQDTITDKGGLFDKLVLTDLSLDDLLIDTDGDDWIISVKDSDDQITITDANHWATGRIETIEVENQTMSYREFEQALSNELDNPYMLVA
ncbi:MAG: putative Ig domain-containing protein [Gammaproteobacteria bacterium]|nr:putative Ig domain-containing protein [Gammaproteobacteria bacterium]